MNIKYNQIYNLSTWFLMVFFLLFLFVIGFNVRLQTDDLVLLNLYKSNSLIDAYQNFPFNFRLGSYSLFYFLFKPVNPSMLKFYIGLFYIVIFSFSLLLCQSTLKFYISYFKHKKLPFLDRIKISLYFLMFAFFYSETLSETWFWTNAILTYFLPFFIALYLSTLFFREKISWSHYLVLALGNCYIGGASESFALVWLFIQSLLLIQKLKKKENYGFQMLCSLLTVLPIFINYLSTKISYRLNFESQTKTLNFNPIETLTSFVSHFELMDIFAFFILILFIIELKIKNWNFPFISSKNKWVLVILVSYFISLALNLIVFKAFTPMRTFNAFNQVSSLFLFLMILNYSFVQLKAKVIQLSIPFAIVGTSVFYYYFNRQVNLTTMHRIAYDNRIEALRKNKDENKIVVCKPLPNPGITVYADFTNDPLSYSNEQFKNYFNIKGKFITE